VTGSIETPSVRQLAAAILLQVESRQAYADVLLDQALKNNDLNQQDSALLTELVYGALRWRGAIDARLAPQLRRPLSAADGFIRNLLRVTVYQLFFLDKIPDYAAVNEAVESAKRRYGARSAGFVNGVLRNLLRQKTPNDAAPGAVAALSHPEWLIERWIAEFGAAEASALMHANNQRAPLAIRANRLKISRDRLLQRLADSAVSANPSRWSPDGIVVDSGGAVTQLPGYGEGLFQVQAESAQLVAHLLAPKPGERILDACAAPGGKTCHIAELIHDSGTVIALDISRQGVERIRANAERLGLRSVRAMTADLTEPLGDEYALSFDRILVDAPCSGLGTLRGHPEIKWRRRQSDIARLSRLQKKILQSIAGYLKPGGVLVYSTCTLAREENDRVIEEFCAGHKEFELHPAASYLPPQARSMARGAYFEALPQRHNTDGFFAARLRKVLS